VAIIFGEKDLKIAPSLLFANEQLGKAEEAINLYTDLFENSEKTTVTRFGDAYPGFENNIQFAEFKLDNQTFTAMESHIPHEFSFNEAFSFLITCENQEEVDFFGVNF